MSHDLVAAIAVAIALVIIVVVAAATTLSMRRYGGYLEGLWAGDPGFLEQAQLSDFQLYIGPRKKGLRQGYLVMVDDAGNFVANQAIEIKEPRSCSRWSSALSSAFKSRRDAFTMRGVQITYSETKDAPIPSELKMTVSILDGTLTLHGDGKVYAFLEKDIAASIAAAEVEAAP